MGPSVFDEYVRRVGATTGRRGALRLLGGALLAGALGARPAGAAARDCAADARDYRDGCGDYCDTTYGFDRDLYNRCFSNCTACVRYIKHCNNRQAKRCIKGFDRAW